MKRVRYAAYSYTRPFSICHGKALSFACVQKENSEIKCASASHLVDENDIYSRKSESKLKFSIFRKNLNAETVENAFVKQFDMVDTLQ